MAGDWSYPVVDASREHARRRIRDEEDAILSGKFKRTRKGKDRGNNNNGGDPSKRPLVQHRPGSYGALAESSSHQNQRRRQHQTSSRSDPSTSSDHPDPIGGSIVNEVSILARAALPGHDEDEEHSRFERVRDRLHLPFGKKHEDELPSDAVDLVVEDTQAEEEEMLRQRRRGEPTAKRTRVYRKAYVPPGERKDQSSSLVDEVKQGKKKQGEEIEDSVEDESAKLRDVVDRDEDKDGPSRSSNGNEDDDEIVRIRVKEEETIVTEVSSESHHEDSSNPWH